MVCLVGWWWDRKANSEPARAEASAGHAPAGRSRRAKTGGDEGRGDRTADQEEEANSSGRPALRAARVLLHVAGLNVAFRPKFDRQFAERIHRKGHLVEGRLDMFGIYNRLLELIPEGRLQRSLRSITVPKPNPKPKPPPRPRYWRRAAITHTMADSRRENWERILEPYRHELTSVLEIGSYEGQSALFWINFLGAHVTCIDNWMNSADGTSSAREVEAHFDANVGRRVHKIKSNSTPALHQLACDDAAFDLIYIDGDHSRDQVMVDSLLAWRCLRVGGIMIWDDYEAYLPGADDRDRPTPAINYFVAMQGAAVSVIQSTGQQLFVRRML
jgi:Methyltransferase domain